MDYKLRGLGFKGSYLRVTFWQRHAYRIVIISAVGVFLAVCLVGAVLP